VCLGFILPGLRPRIWDLLLLVILRATKKGRLLSRPVCPSAILKGAQVTSCEKCGRKMIVVAKGSHLRVNSMLGHIDFNREVRHCRYCGEGYAPFDRELKINQEHKITRGLTETICDLAQKMPSFMEASEVLSKYLNIKVSHTFIQVVSEEVGKDLYKAEKYEAEDLYKNQYKAIKDIPEDKKRGRIYIETDGSMVLIKGQGWKEIKLGMVFKDDKILNRNKERHISIDKDYVAHLGSAEEFKKMFFSTAVKNGYQEAKEVVILGDGAKWIWNIAEELFPDAVCILDFYHFKEHVVNMLFILKMNYPERDGRMLS
jgi:hypothetical protein